METFTPGERFFTIENHELAHVATMDVWNSRDAFWRRFLHGKVMPVPPVASTEEDQEAGEVHVHMPSPSYFPLVAALGLPIIGYGLIYHLIWVDVIGLLVLLTGVYAWALEPPTEPDVEIEAHGEPDHPDGDGEPEPIPALTAGGTEGGSE